MKRYVQIEEKEMRDFLSSQGFSEVKLNRTKELVMGKIIAPNTCLRCYTTIQSGVAREKGKDAIRFAVVRKKEDGNIIFIGGTTKVLRTNNWKSNMLNRIENAGELIGPKCPQCGNHTVERGGKHGSFFGCVNYPSCKGYINKGVKS